jgi:4-hydroxy-tetrahydrodipicolinate synthase
MARFNHLKGVFGLLPTPYQADYEIHIPDLKAVAEFCCSSGQHGIVWPVMVGEFYFLGEEERLRGLDAVLEQVNGRLPVVFGCSGVSLSQVLLFARAAQTAGADSIIAMAPARTNAALAIEMYKRMADVYDGPIMVQNADAYAPLTGEQIAQLVEDVPSIEYIKEERQPGPKHIAEVYDLVGDKVKTIFGGAAGKFLPDELLRGADGCMPACEVADVLTKIMEIWWTGDQEAARELHRRLLPLILLETHPMMRYVLQQRGVFSNTIGRTPDGAQALNAGDKAEIARAFKYIEGDLNGYPFKAE